MSPGCQKNGNIEETLGQYKINGIYGSYKANSPPYIEIWSKVTGIPRIIKNGPEMSPGCQKNGDYRGQYKINGIYGS